jgi:hypothetical protein
MVPEHRPSAMPSLVLDAQERFFNSWPRFSKPAIVSLCEKRAEFLYGWILATYEAEIPSGQARHGFPQ